MKRFTQLLSLFLLSLVGITTAVAQDFTQGTLLTTTAEVVGQKVCLWAPGTSTDHPAGYLVGTTQLKASTNYVPNEGIFQFVAVGEQAGGNDLYYLQQVETGLYIKAYDEGNEDEPFLMTKNQSEAYKMTVLPFEEVDPSFDIAGRTRQSASNAKQDLSNPGFVLAADKLVDGGILYIGSVYSPFHSPYVDTNVWNIYTLTPVTGYNKVANYIGQYFPSEPTETFPVGKDPGQYDEAVVTAAVEAYNRAMDVLNGVIEITDEEADALCKELKAAYDNIVTVGKNPINGYYFIQNGNNRVYTSSVVDDTEWLWAHQASAYTIPETLTPSDLKNIWKITPTDVENQYYAQNVITKSYITGLRKANSSGQDAYYMGEQTPIGIACEGTNFTGAFMIYQCDPENPDSRLSYPCCNGAYNYLVHWAVKNDPNNNVRFITVDESVVNELYAEAAQDALNESLKALYDKADAAYQGSLDYSGAPKDALFTENGGYIKDATAQVFTTTLETSEGSIAESLDGDISTYFHSPWTSGNFTPSLDGNYHYLAVDLGEAVDGVFQIKMAKRLNTQNEKLIDYPTRVAIFGSNDATVVSDPDNVDLWTLLGESSPVWNIDATYNEKAFAGTVGIATLPFEGSYRYIKMAVIGTDQGRGYFALSEFNVYKGVLNPAGGTIAQVSAETKALIEAEMAKAKTELAAGAATQAQIDALKAAYDKFMYELPDASKLTDEIAATKAVLDAAVNGGMIGEEVGYYPSAAQEALQTAIDVAEAYDCEGKLASEINAQVDLLKAAVVAFNESLTLPEAGKFYTIRGRSNNINQWSPGLTSYGAQVYSRTNSLTGSIYFTRPDGASWEWNTENGDGNRPLTDEELAEKIAALSDTVHAEYDSKYLWLVEKAEAGKMVIRNMATGMYIAGVENAAGNVVLGQSTEPFELEVSLGKAGVFMFNIGGTYMNANSGGYCVAWADAADRNAWWGFEAVEQEILTNLYDYNWPVTPGIAQILSLPIAVLPVDNCAYSVEGISTDNKLVLASYGDDEIPAATPFVYLAPETLEVYGHATFEISFGGDDFSSSTSPIEYCFEPKKVEAIQGTLCETVTVPEGFAYLNGSGEAVATNNTEIGANGGYFIEPTQTGVDVTGKQTIDLGDIVISSIDDANIVVLPAKVSVYTIDGQLLRKNVKSNSAVKGLPAGIYVVGGVKMIVK